MIEVELNKNETFQSALVGVARQTSSLFKKSKNKFTTNDNEWQIHILGALGERAVAKALGIYYPGSVDTYKEADLPPNYQVRTRSKDDGDLIVREGDADDEIFILVTGTGPKFMVRGYMKGKDAKKKEWLKSPNGWSPAYFVPQCKLEHIEDLLEK